MGKLVIISDSHGLETELAIIQARHQADYYIHCGDSELSESHKLLANYQVVKGNCDWQAAFPEELLLEVDGLRIYITHGHLYQVKDTLMTLEYRALELEADLVCFGHSHIAYAEKMDQQIFLNPGSIRLPKRYPIASYVVVTWSGKSEIKVNFYQIDGKHIETLPYKNTFSIFK